MPRIRSQRFEDRRIEDFSDQSRKQSSVIALSDAVDLVTGDPIVALYSVPTFYRTVAQVAIGHQWGSRKYEVQYTKLRVGKNPSSCCSMVFYHNLIPTTGSKNPVCTCSVG